jgi:hypothetical protein
MARSRRKLSLRGVLTISGISLATLLGFNYYKTNIHPAVMRKAGPRQSSNR